MVVMVVVVEVMGPVLLSFTDAMRVLVGNSGPRRLVAGLLATSASCTTVSGGGRISVLTTLLSSTSLEQLPVLRVPRSEASVSSSTEWGDASPGTETVSSPGIVLQGGVLSDTACVCEIPWVTSRPSRLK